jgi:two-component system cell cycle sensor histidine kinase/response regulator CckA
MVMAKRQSRAISEGKREKSIPTLGVVKKKMDIHLQDRRRKRSLKNSNVASPFPTEHAKSMEKETNVLEQQIEFILGVTRTGLDIIDSNFNIRYIDPEWAKVYGDPAGKKCYEYFMDRKEVCPNCGIPIALKTKRITVTEETLVKEGNRPIQVTTIPFRDGDGEWLVAEVNVDISERKRTEEALRKAHEELEIRVQERTAELARANEAMQAEIIERKQTEENLQKSEEKYRTILETMQEAYYELDLAGHFTFVNDALCKHLGYTKEELIGTKSNQYQDEANGKKTYQAFNEIYRTGEPVEALGSEYIRKDGTKGTYEMSASLIRDAQGKPIGFRGVTRDITERKRAEEALRQSEGKYRTIIENIQDGYFENDLAGNFTFANDVICRHLGYTREELIGMNYRQYTDEENGRRLFQNYSGLYRTGQPIKPFEAGYVRKDGGKLVAEISVSLIRDSGGKPIAFRGISRDITERKQAEEEKLSLQEQLRQSQKMEAIGQLAGGVAHDFNNLLTVIRGYSQLSLFDLKEDSPLRGNLQEIEKATQRATDLTRQLLAFSRRQILDLKVVDLNALLKDLEKMLRRIIGEDIELVTLLSGDLGKVKVDPSQIEQVIFNLAVNARDAMPSGGKLAIETANVELDEEYAHAHVNVAPGRYVRLSVSDTGVGMSQETKEKVFEPFFTTKAKGKGTGLGLSMVYGIVKQSNGNIWLYSEPNRGTTFRIYFPRTEEEADTLHEREETDFFPRGTETVLLVEDDELVRDLATRLLEQQGYRVLKAGDGQEALLVAKERVGETIHLLLADIVMPQMGGKELADWLKISRPNVKVLYMSGYADNAIVHHGLLDPGTHFLQKPFSLKTLSHKVREVLDG